MELVIKHFNELTAHELYAILKLRVSVFVVEQNCPYQEVDNIDTDAWHIYLKNDSEIVAYLRVFKCEEYRNKFLNLSETVHNTAVIGRVMSSIRRKGYATELLNAAVDFIKNHFDTEFIVIEAQVYAADLYKKIGFVQTSEEFLEDGIPHIQMLFNCR